MSFQYLTWLDSGAPTLTGQNGSLTNSGNTGVLDWALVTKAGWTKSFSATNGSVFTPVSGNTVLMVIHDSATSGNARAATVRGGESASGVASASLTNPFPTVALSGDTLSTWTLSNSADATQRPYYLLVTDSFLFAWFGYINTTVNYNTLNTTTSTHCYGQFSKAISSDSYNTIISIGNIAAPASNSMFTNSCSSVPVVNTRLWADRSPDGSIFSPAQTLITPSVSGIGVPGSASMPSYPNSVDTKLHLNKVAVGDTYTQSGALGAHALQVRGWIPNIWQPLESIGTLVNSKTFVDSSYNGAALFQVLVMSTVIYLALETTNTWSAPGV